MKRTIKNKTIHIIRMESGFLHSFETKTMEITQKELDKYKDKISVCSVLDDDVYILPKENKEKENIMNSGVVDDYLSRSSKTVLAALESDKGRLTAKDLNLLCEFEEGHKNRDSILKRIKELRGE